MSGSGNELPPAEAAGQQDQIAQQEGGGTVDEQLRRASRPQQSTEQATDQPAPQPEPEPLTPQERVDAVAEQSSRFDRADLRVEDGEVVLTDQARLEVAARNSERFDRADLRVEDGEVVLTDEARVEAAASQSPQFDTGDLRLQGGEITVTDDALIEQAAAESPQFDTGDFLFNADANTISLTDEARVEAAASQSSLFDPNDLRVGQGGLALTDQGRLAAAAAETEFSESELRLQGGEIVPSDAALREQARDEVAQDAAERFSSRLGTELQASDVLVQNLDGGLFPRLRDDAVAELPDATEGGDAVSVSDLQRLVDTDQIDIIGFGGEEVTGRGVQAITETDAGLSVSEAPEGVIPGQPAPEDQAVLTVGEPVKINIPGAADVGERRTTGALDIFESRIFVNGDERGTIGARADEDNPIATARRRISFDTPGEKTISVPGAGTETITVFPQGATSNIQQPGRQNPTFTLPSNRAPEPEVTSQEVETLLEGSREQRVETIATNETLQDLRQRGELQLPGDQTRADLPQPDRPEPTQPAGGDEVSAGVGGGIGQRPGFDPGFTAPTAGVGGGIGQRPGFDAGLGDSVTAGVGGGIGQRPGFRGGDSQTILDETISNLEDTTGVDIPGEGDAVQAVEGRLAGAAENIRQGDTPLPTVAQARSFGEQAAATTVGDVGDQQPIRVGERTFTGSEALEQIGGQVSAEAARAANVPQTALAVGRTIEQQAETGANLGAGFVGESVEQTNIRGLGAETERQLAERLTSAGERGEQQFAQTVESTVQAVPESVEQAQERPARALGTLGFAGGSAAAGTVGTRALSRLSSAAATRARSATTRLRADETIDFSDLTSDRAAERGELPLFRTDTSAPDVQAVREVQRRGADVPDAVAEGVGSDRVLFQSTPAELPDEFGARRGSSEIPGLFTSPDASPLRLRGGAAGDDRVQTQLLSTDVRLPRLSDFTAEQDRLAAFPGDRIEAAPAQAAGSGRRRVPPSGLRERLNERLGRREPQFEPDPDTPAAQFFDEDAREGTAFVRPQSDRTTELESIFPPGTRFAETDRLAVRLGEPFGDRTVPLDVFRRADDVTVRDDRSALRRFVDDERGRADGPRRRDATVVTAGDLRRRRRRRRDDGDPAIGPPPSAGIGSFSSAGGFLVDATGPADGTTDTVQTGAASTTRGTAATASTTTTAGSGGSGATSGGLFDPFSTSGTSTTSSQPSTSGGGSSGGGGSGGPSGGGSGGPGGGFLPPGEPGSSRRERDETPNRDREPDPVGATLFGEDRFVRDVDTVGDVLF